ncbi:MAG: hypothetical protein AAF197_06855 [Pseudomonadota bacterium]
MFYSKSRQLLIGAFITFIALSCFAIEDQQSSYGQTDFYATGDAKAQVVFKKGLLQLHNFEFKDARQSFKQTLEIDPDFAMAWWGEALSHWHPLWPYNDVDGGRAVLQRMGDSPAQRTAMGKTERERAYLASIEYLFADGDLLTRRHAYSDALKALSEKYPDDLDAAAFYALSILAKSNGRKYHYYMQAGAVTEEILDRNPLHPGALHYNIHSYDDTIHAPLGLRAARDYYKVAPSAVHALHMGAHIYYATGKWELGLDRNIDSFDEAVARMPDPNGRYDPEGYHSLAWIPYGFQQIGDTTNALIYLDLLADQARRFPEHPVMPMGRMHFIEARASYIVDTQDWESDLLDQDVSHEKLPPYYVATDNYIKGLVALKKGEVKTAKSYLEKMGNPPMPKSGPRTKLGPALLKLALAGQISLVEGDKEDGLELLQKAAEIDLDWPSEAGPVKPVQPMVELLAQTYHRLGDFEKARKYYELTELYSVGRALTKHGLKELDSISTLD